VLKISFRVRPLIDKGSPFVFCFMLFDITTMKYSDGFCLCISILNFSIIFDKERRNAE